MPPLHSSETEQGTGKNECPLVERDGRVDMGVC